MSVHSWHNTAIALTDESRALAYHPVISLREDYSFPCLLLSNGAVPVKPAALKEAVTHHAVAQPKKQDRKQEYKQELSGSERGWLSSSRVRRIP